MDFIVIWVDCQDIRALAAVRFIPGLGGVTFAMMLCRLGMPESSVESCSVRPFIDFRKHIKASREGSKVGCGG